MNTEGKTCMRRFIVSALIASTAGLLACTLPAQKEPAPETVAIEQQWSGFFPTAGIESLPAGQQSHAIGYFPDPEAFGRAWRRFMPQQPVPAVDFTRSLVLFARNVRFFNPTSIV